MKICVINGSARKGNSLSIIEALVRGAGEKNEIEVIRADMVNMDYCKGCDACECVWGCVDKDDTNEVIGKLVAADMIIFVTPVYWWGMTAQLKTIIDKCYCRGMQLKGKKIGVAVVGGAPVDSIQYRLIREQFECMAEYLAWEKVFYRDYSASGSEELRSNEAAMKELEAIGKEL